MADEFSEIMGHLSENARFALQKADFYSKRYNQGYMGTEHLLMGILAQPPGGYKLVGENFTEEPYGIAVNHGQEEFLEAINQALIRIPENGMYEQIYAKWIP